jgi:phage shock protein C
MLMNRRLYRCRHDRRIAGVAGGLAEYFELDPTLVRVVWFVSIFFGLVTLVLYVGMALIVPLEPLTAEEAAAHAAGRTPSGHRHASGGPSRWPTYLGLVLILFGALALLDVSLPSVSWRQLWPVFIAGLGALLIAGSMRRDTALTATGPTGPATAAQASTPTAAMATEPMASGEPAIEPAAEPVPDSKTEPTPE